MVKEIKVSMEGTKSNLESASLYKVDGHYYLKLVYICESESEVFRLTFPKVEPGIPMSLLRINNAPFDDDFISIRFNTICDNEHELFKDCDGNYMYYEIINTKVHEMTVEEIEKKLGYKVKIISKEEETDGKKDNMF